MDQWLLDLGQFTSVLSCFPSTIVTASEVGNLFIYPTVEMCLTGVWLAGCLAESPCNPSLAMMSFAKSIGCKVLKRGLLTLVTSRSLSLQKPVLGGGKM